MKSLGMMLIIAGIGLIFMGLILVVLPKIGFFRLPGDILVKKDGVVIFIPIVSMLLLSLFLTLILNLFFKR